MDNLKSWLKLCPAISPGNKTLATVPGVLVTVWRVK